MVDAPLDKSFLRRSDLFESQPETILQAVAVQGRLEELGPGDVLFNKGDEGDRLYIVQSGVIEVLAEPGGGADSVPVAYLGPGEVLGELALLTGSPRSATARAPERAVVLTLDKTVFQDLMANLPDFARNLCLVLARRLEATTSKVPRGTPKQLEGNLRFFDLATVIQTLIGSHQTGTLTVAQEGSGEKLAELFFFKGNVCRARLKHLSGDDAVYQLFQAPLDGEFSFVGRTVTEEEVQSDVTLPAISLLMEAIRLQDELPLLQAKIPDPLRVFRQQGGELRWEEAESLELAVAVWSRVKKGASVADLQREIPRCSYAIYRTLATLLEAGQVSAG